MNHRQVIIKAGALLAVLAMVATACGGTKKNSSTTGTTEAPKTLAAAPGFDPVKNEIHLGVITPLTGPVAVIGNPLTNGTDTWFKKINDAGGIAGKYKVILDKQDSQYVPATGVTGYNAIKGNVAMIAQLLGTPVTKAILPLLKSDNITAAPASLDADWVREPNLLPVGGPYQIQMINALDYMITDGGAKTKKLCSLTQNDAYGDAGKAGLDFGASKLGVTFTKQLKFTATTPTAPSPDLKSSVDQLKSSACDVVFLVSTPTDTGGAMAEAAGKTFAPQWVGQSPTWIGAFTASPLLPYLQAHFLLAAEGTEWGDTSVKGMSDLVADATKYAPTQKPDIYFVFGYYQARAVTALLEKAVELGDLSRQGIQKALTKLGTVSFDGLTGDYKYGAAADREPPRVSTLFKVNAAKPGGLEKLKSNIESDTAKQYKFAG